MSASDSEARGGWTPLAANTLAEIRETFAKIFPAAEYNDLASASAALWIEKLEQVWNSKAEESKAEDMMRHKSRRKEGQPCLNITTRTS